MGSNLKIIRFKRYRKELVLKKKNGMNLYLVVCTESTISLKRRLNKFKDEDKMENW